MNHLVTFSDSLMSRSAELCVESAKQHGVETALPWTRETGFYPDQLEALMANRSRGGGGFFAWKPYIILDAMESRTVKNGDVLIYSDAGIEFINNVNYIIDRMDRDIWLFGNMYEHAHWCKRDVVDEIMPLNYMMRYWPDEYQKRGCCLVAEKDRCNAVHWDNFGKQVQASVIFFRVNDHTRAFVKEWLDWCLFEGGRLIDDSPSRAPNHPEFRENRHDQAILTTMAYRDGIPLHYWPAQYNDGAFEYPRGDYPDEGYPILFHHHRKRNHEWEAVA